MHNSYHLYRITRVLNLCLIGILISSCSQYQIDKYHELAGGSRGWDVAGKIELSPTETEIKLPADVRFKSFGAVKIYFETLDNSLPKNDAAEKKCLQGAPLGIICLRDGKAVEISGSLVKADGETEELTYAAGKYGIAGLQFPPEYNLANKDVWKEFAVLRLRTSEPLSVDRIVIWDW